MSPQPIQSLLQGDLQTTQKQIIETDNPLQATTISRNPQAKIKTTNGVTTVKEKGTQRRHAGHCMEEPHRYIW